MSSRKRNARATSPNQRLINSFLTSKPKATATSKPTKRLVQSSLTARPLRSRKPVKPEPDDVLDLTQSTSPGESDSPPSAKKRKLRATGQDRLSTRGVAKDHAESSMSPPSPHSPSPVPSPRHKSQATPARLDDDVQRMGISPSPAQSQYSQLQIPDPDETIESSQTQYLHLRFTPQSQRVMTVGAGRIPAPVFTPNLGQISGSPRATSRSPSVFHIPSSQGEVSEPATPRKRTRSSVGRSENAPRTHQQSDALDDIRPVSQELTTSVSPPNQPLSIKTPSKLNFRDRLTSNGTSGPRFASPRRPIFTPRRLVDRSDYVPSSQAEPSLAPTELGTVESPLKLTRYPSIDTDLLTTIPSSVPASQEPQQIRSHTPHRATTPPLPISDINQIPPRTPPQRTVGRDPPSSPTDMPSPGQLLSSLGLAPARSANSAAAGQTYAISSSPGSPKAGHSNPPANASESDRPPLQTNDSPMHSQSSSQSVIPSSQPAHDSTPPPDYDMDPEIHSINQAHMQLRSQLFDQAPSAFASRNPSNLRPTSDSNRPYFTARTHQSPMQSSQSLPPSQSPIKGGRIDPDQSAAGVHGVFGMLGFGSEANHDEDSQVEAPRPTTGDEEESPDAHIPISFDLPPSSPPPQTPAREVSREPSPESQVLQSKRKTVVRSSPVRDSPLHRAFEVMRNRGKQATPSTTRQKSDSMANRIVSSPIRVTHMDQPSLMSSPVMSPRSGIRGRATKTGQGRSQSVGQSPAHSRRVPKMTKPTHARRSPIHAPTGRSYSRDRDEEVVESSDAEEAMEIEAHRPSRASLAPKAPQARKRASKDDVQMSDVEPSTPHIERLPSSVSPSPIRIHDSPPRAISPLPENTQTQEETETLWESIRPSQSVSQVFERRLIEEAVEEAERGRRLRMEQDAEKRKAKKREEHIINQEQDDEMRERSQEEPQREEESQDQPPARPVTISLNPQSPSTVSAGLPSAPLPCVVSTPKSRRIAREETYVVTPTKVMKRTPVKTHKDRMVIIPSSPLEEEDPDEEYTYIEETYNPTESQRSFLDRILQGTSSEME